MAGIEFQPPRFTLSLKDIEVDEGGSAKLEANVTGFPVPAVKWLHNGNDVTNSINYEILSDSSGRCSLYIPEVFDEDSGVFTCFAANGAGEAESTAKFVVKTHSVAPQFTQHMKPAQGKQGETIVFEVKTSGSPAPRIKWYREGAEIRNSEDFRMVTVGNTHTLTIAEAYEEDTGRFTVTASNAAGKAVSAAMLTVSGEGSVASAGAEPEMQQTKQATRGREASTAGPSDTDFVLAPGAAKLPPVASPKSSARKQSPSPIRRVRMSPPRTHHALDSQQAQRRQIRSVKPPSLSPTRSAATAAHGKLESTDQEPAVFPPFFKFPAKNVEVVEGEMSKFECRVIGNPTPFIKWYREGALIESSQDFQISFDGQSCSLVIRETFVDDAGMFTCTAQNKAGSTSCSALLTVTVPETEDEAGPAFKPGMTRSISETELSMTDYDGFESTELDFVSGVSDVELTDTEFKPSGPATMHLDAPDPHVGKKLSPIAERTSTTPSGKGSAPTLLSAPPATMNLEEGGAMRLSFVITGSPAPNITWAKNGNTIQHGYRFKLDADQKKNTYQLSVGMLFSEDAGEYTITATNRFGFIRGTVNLLMEDDFKRQSAMDGQQLPRGRGDSRKMTASSRKPVSPGRMASPSKRLDEVEELDIEKCFRPRFLRKPENLECNEGTATRIDCKVSGRPLPIVMWHHNGVLMHEDYSHRVVVKEDGVRSLIISPATPRDGGEYTVVAQNKAGKAVSSVTLTVIPKEGSERPRILEKPQSVNVNEGDMVRLEVFAVGRPTPEIVWLKDNVLLIPDKHPEIRIEGVDGHGLLTIPVASRVLHDAWYTATAVNKVGRDLTRCKVKVAAREVEPEPERKLYIPKSARKLYPPDKSPDRLETRKIDNFDETDLYDEKRLQKPRIKKKLTSVRQKLLGSAHFECHIVPIGDPSLKVEWLLDGKPIEFANRIMTTCEFGYCAMDINAVYPRDSGVISCRATNAHGQAQTSCTLVVKDTKGLVEATQLPEKQQLENIERREREFKGVGEKYATVYPTDEEVPHAPHIVLDMDPARVKEGEPARFRCRITGFPHPKVEWFLNEQSIRKSKRFRLWCDGIHYFEIAHVRGYDTGAVRMVATNTQGKVESRAALEVYQADDFRTVLHHAEKVPTTDGDTDLTVKRYRTSRAIEDQLREENARRMVSQLKQVDKPSLPGQKKPGTKETGKELQSKFKQLTEGDHISQTYKVDKKMPSEFRDREYVRHIRDTRSSLTHWEEEKDEKSTIPWLERPKETIPGFEIDEVTK